jgi:hypothetical protein
MIRAISGNVFIKRDEENMEGVIKAVENDKFVVCGDKVHIPHYGVTDMEIDGEEYAVAKASELFAVLEGETYKPINRHIKVRKCVNDHMRDKSGEIALYMTENHIENTNWVEIIDVAKDCDKIVKKYIGYFCVSPENSERLSRILYSKDFMLHEDEVEFVTNGD